MPTPKSDAIFARLISIESQGVSKDPPDKIVGIVEAIIAKVKAVPKTKNSLWPFSKSGSKYLKG